jgi:crotonobetainyl-CoA:carnitine CoA-transferase CaiB-like acyl-CoA transferase
VSTGALTGIRVLDLGRLLAAPTAAQVLGDLGADVIKVERPGSGDMARFAGPSFLTDDQGQAGQSSLFISANRNKRSVTVSLSDPDGQAIVRALAARSDVLIENFVPGTMRRYGLGYESLRGDCPQLVYCSVTGFGQDGPGASRPGYDGILQAYSGLMSATGIADGEPGAGPLRIGPSTIDAATGVHAAAGIMAALLHRDRISGQGQYLDMSLLGTAIAVQAHWMTDYLISGQLPGRTGNGSHPVSRVYRCADGAVILQAGQDKDFRALCGVLGAPELAGDERFATAKARAAHAAELIAVLQQLFLKHSKQDLIAALQRAQVAGAPVQDYDEVFADPQVLELGMRAEVPHPHDSAATMPGVGSPFRLSATPPSYQRHPPALGEHTDEILRELLDYDDATISRLRAQGAI